MICAIARDEVGVDIEQMRSDLNIEMIAEDVFAPLDYDAYRNLREGSKSVEFFGIWTRLEAFIKTTGQGLSGLSLQPAGVCPPGSKFDCKYFDPAPGYQGALVIRKGNWKFNYWQWAF
jgi:hypothetical protein